MLPTPISERKCVSMWPAQQGIRFFMIRRTWAHVTLAIFDFNFEFSKFHIPKSGSIKKWWCFACFPLPSLKENVAPCDQPSRGIEFSMIRWPWANLALAIWHFHLFFFEFHLPKSASENNSAWVLLALHSHPPKKFDSMWPAQHRSRFFYSQKSLG